MALTGIDVAALGIAANALPAAKAYTDSAIAALPAGVHLKGTVNYYADLPASPADGDAYTVLYKGVSPSTEPDGTEYAWAAAQNVWVALGADISGKADKAASAVAGDLAGLDANGNLVDSGKKAADFVWTGAQTLTAAEKAQVLSNLGTEQYSSAEKTKLSGIEAGADVTDAANVESSGAIMKTAQVLSSAEKEQARTNIGAGTYSLPSGGMPSSEMSAAVQASLGKADGAVLVSEQALTEGQKIQALKNLDGVRIVSLTDGTETLAQLVTRLAAINTAGEHVFFDVAALSYPLYLCTIAVEYSGSTPVTYRLNDLVSGKFSLGSYDGTKTLSTILSEAVSAYYTLTVTCTTLDGATVTGQTVTVRQESASGVVYSTASYNGQTVSFALPDGFKYFVSVSDTLAGHFSPSTASGTIVTNASCTLTYNDAAHITTYAAVISALTSLADPTAMIGQVEIADTWVAEDGTSYSDPMMVVDVKDVTDADGNTHLAAIMQRKWATLNAIQFDAPENEAATEETATAGLYYIGKSGDTYTKLTLSAGDPIPYSSYDAMYHNAINFDGNMVKNGYNRWGHSAYRQYLNSSAGVGLWWTAQHIGDVQPNELLTKRGYKAGCSAALLAAAKPIKINCSLNTVTDGGVMEQTVDTFWLPSGIEMYGTANSGEGTYFPYWKTATGLSSPSDSANSGRIQYSIANHSTAVYCRLRSASRSYSYYTWGCSATGQLSYSNAGSSNRAVPACAIY